MTDPAWAPWAAVLDRLEADVTLAERLSVDPSGPSPEPWAPPELEGPIPAALVDRAHHLIARQLQAQQTLNLAMSSTVRQQEFTTRVDRATRRTEMAHFVDISA